MRYSVVVGILGILFSGSIWAASSIILAAPQGGEVYVPGKSATVSFVPLAQFTSVKVELSRDGTTYATLGTVAQPVANQASSLTWAVSGAATSSAIVRLTALPGNVIVSSSAFSISALGAAGLADASVTTAKLADKSVTTAKLADSAVTTVKIADKAVTNAKLADNAVTSTKLAPLSVTVDKLSSGPLSSNYVLATNGIGGAQWIVPSAPNTWNLNGNAATTAGVNFLGTVDPVPLELRVDNQRAVTYQYNHNLVSIVGGHPANSILHIAAGSVISGGGEADFPNHIEGQYAFIGAGYGNSVVSTSEFGGAVAGGLFNVVGANYGVIGGGLGNDNEGEASVIGGGNVNKILNGTMNGVVSGGASNTIDGSNNSAIGGGFINTIPTGSLESVIGGGKQNTASGIHSTIAGGFMNSAANAAAIAGGEVNNADAYSFIGGGNQNTAAPYSAVAGGETNSASQPHSFVGGGRMNSVDAFGEFSIVLGGEMNRATNYHSATLSGLMNSSDNGAVVVGGQSNSAVGTISFIGGGIFNSTGGALNVVAGGAYNVADAGGSSVGGGNDNRALGEYSTIPGGSHNIAQGQYSFAAGIQANAAHDGTFVWVDNSQTLQTQWASTAPNQFILRAAGGVGINTNAPNSNLQVAGSIAETLTQTSTNITLGKAHDIVAVNSTSAALTVTLPTAAGISGRRYTVKKTDATANAVKVQAGGTQKIDGASSLLLSAQWKYVTIISDGSNWLVIGQN